MKIRNVEQKRKIKKVLAMKNKLAEAYMETAWTFSTLSHAVRLKVGCVVVKNDTIIGIGYNGMPSGWDNVCEYKVFQTENDQYEYNYEEDGRKYRLVTRPEVLHAESNALAKIARSTLSSVGSTIFVTHSPCIECAKIIHQAGIESLYYCIDYRSSDGLDFLIKSNVDVRKMQTP